MRCYGGGWEWGAGRMYREASPDVRIFKTQCLITPRWQVGSETRAVRGLWCARRTLTKRECECRTDGRVLAALTEQGRSRRGRRSRSGGLDWETDYQSPGLSAALGP